MNKTWLIKENIVKVLGDSDISRIKLDETTWVDNDGNLIIPDILLGNTNRSKYLYDVSLQSNEEKLNYRQELSSVMENLLGKPILFSKESNIIGIGILTGSEFCEIDGIQLSFEYTEITVRNGKLFHFSYLRSVSTEHWTEIRELSVEEYEEIKTKLLNYYRKPFRIKYEID